MHIGIIKIISAYLALLAIMAPLVSLLFLQVQQVYIRNKMHEKLEYSLLQTICIEEKNVQWTEPDKEVRIGNKLFDVKYYKIENGIIFATGLYDHEETFIEEHLNDIATHSHSEGTSLVVLKLLHLLQSVFFSQIKFSDFYLVNTHPYSEHYNSPLLTAFKTILTPPPQF